MNEEWTVRETADGGVAVGQNPALPPQFVFGDVEMDEGQAEVLADLLNKLQRERDEAQAELDQVRMAVKSELIQQRSRAEAAEADATRLAEALRELVVREARGRPHWCGEQVGTEECDGAWDALKAHDERLKE